MPVTCLLVSAALWLLPGAQFDQVRLPETGRSVPAVVYHAGEPTTGVPIGGLGTGAIELDGTGRFRGSTVQYSVIPGPTIPQACLGVWAGSDRRAGARLLQTEPAPPAEGVRDLRLAGHWPFAELDPVGTGLPVDVRVTAWTPIVAREAELSATPALLLRVYLTNPGPRPRPAAAALAWPNDVTTPGEAAGNVGGWLGWERESLAPGETWRSRLALALAAETEEARAAAGVALSDALPTAFARQAEGFVALAKGDLTAFFVDAAGGFNWEPRREESFRTRAVPAGNLGQMVWALHYSAGAERRSLRAALDMAGDCRLAGGRLDQALLSADGSALQQTILSDDGALRLTITTWIAAGVVLREYRVQSLGQQPLTGLLLGHYMNWDLGGPAGRESDDTASAARDGALGFSDESLAAAMLGEPRPTLYAVGPWAEARDALYAARGSAFADLPEGVHPVNRLVAGGVYLGDSEGTRGYYLSALGGRTTVAPDAEGLADWWPDFADKGEVRPARGKDGPVGVVAATTVVPPRATSHLDFILTWHFPDLRDSDGKLIGREYARRFSSPLAAGQWLRVAGRLDDLLRRTLDWQERIYAADLSPWLQDALINGLYSWARNTAWIADGRFSHSESFTGCSINETIVCRFAGSWPLMLLFPDLERNTMRQFIHHQTEEGAIPFAFGGGLRFDSPYYETQKSLDSSEFVLMAWRDYWYWRDPDWLREALPAVKKAVAYGLTLDTDGDGLINEVSMQYYDVWRFHGTSAYVAGIWLAALRAAEEMAAAAGDDDFAGRCRELFTRGRAAYEAKLWTGRYYRLYNEPETGRLSDVCLGNQLAGQWYAYLSGLGEILPRDHILSALQWVSKLNGAHTPYGVTNGVRPDGTAEPGAHSDCVSIGETFACAATAISAGLPELGLPEAEEAYRNVALLQKTPWNIYFNHSAEDGHMIWGLNYYSNMSLWTVALALQPRLFAER